MLLASGCSDTDFEPGTVAAIPQSHSIPSDRWLWKTSPIRLFRLNRRPHFCPTKARSVGGSRRVSGVLENHRSESLLVSGATLRAGNSYQR